MIRPVYSQHPWLCYAVFARERGTRLGHFSVLAILLLTAGGNVRVFRIQLSGSDVVPLPSTPPPPRPTLLGLMLSEGPITSAVVGRPTFFSNYDSVV